MPTAEATETVDRLRVRVYPDRQAMGAAAAGDVAARLRALLAGQARVRAIFASAPSQDELLAGLADAEGIDWSRISVFHMDEYLSASLPPDSPARFGMFLRQRLFDRVRPGEVHLIQATDAPEVACRRYADLLAEAPIDVVCLGIGENGHIAFNDPPVADFDDPALVKVVDIDTVSRQQQVNDGAFARLADVPVRAITLTIPALMSGRHLVCVVPGERKRAAVACTLRGPIGISCPASILRRHADATLYVDAAAYPGPPSAA
jgi:glucosamine-6-phosphate deaminase